MKKVCEENKTKIKRKRKSKKKETREERKKKSACNVRSTVLPAHTFFACGRKRLFSLRARARSPAFGEFQAGKIRFAVTASYSSQVKDKQEEKKIEF